MTKPLELQSIVFTVIGDAMLTTYQCDLMSPPLASSHSELMWRSVTIGLGIPYVLITSRSKIEDGQGIQTSILWIEDDVLKFLTQSTHEIVDIAILVPGEAGSSNGLEFFQVKEVWQSGAPAESYPLYIISNNESIVLGGDDRPNAEKKVLLYSLSNN